MASSSSTPPSLRAEEDTPTETPADPPPAMPPPHVTRIPRIIVEKSTSDFATMGFLTPRQMDILVRALQEKDMRDSLTHLNLLGARVIPYSSWRPEGERRVWRSASVGGTIDVREAEGEGIKQIGGPIARAADPGEGWSGEPIPEDAGITAAANKAVFDEASSSTAAAKSKNKNKNKNKKKKKKKGNLAAIPEEDEESLSDREIREIVQMPIEIDPEVRAAAGSARNKSQDEEEDPDKTPTGPKATPDWGKIPDFKWSREGKQLSPPEGYSSEGEGEKTPKPASTPTEGSPQWPTDPQMEVVSAPTPRSREEKHAHGSSPSEADSSPPAVSSTTSLLLSIDSPPHSPPFENNPVQYDSPPFEDYDLEDSPETGSATATMRTLAVPSTSMLELQADPGPITVPEVDAPLVTPFPFTPPDTDTAAIDSPQSASTEPAMSIEFSNPPAIPSLPTLTVTEASPKSSPPPSESPEPSSPVPWTLEGSLLLPQPSPTPPSPEQESEPPSGDSPAEAQIDIDGFYPLNRSWTLTCSDNSRKGFSPLSPTTAEAYSGGLIHIFTSQDIADLFGKYRALRRKLATSTGRRIEPPGEEMLPNSAGLGVHLWKTDITFQFFATGVQPMWEDPMCAKGGKIMISGSAIMVDQLFTDIMFSLIGGSVEAECPPPEGTSSIILGIVVSRRAVNTRVEVWLGGPEEPNATWINRVEGYFADLFRAAKIFPYRPFGMDSRGPRSGEESHAHRGGQSQHSASSGRRRPAAEGVLDR